jgi:hypothetical protein
MFGKKPKNDLIKNEGWNDEMMSNLIERANLSVNQTAQELLLISQMRKRLNLRTGNQFFMEEEIKFLARSGAKDDDQSHNWMAEIRFPYTHGNLCDLASQISAEAVGYMVFVNDSELTDSGSFETVARMNIALFGDNKVAKRLEELFVNNKKFENTFLPIWITFNFAPIEKMDAEQALNHSAAKPIEITHWAADQSLDLNGPLPQDLLY